MQETPEMVEVDKQRFYGWYTENEDRVISYCHTICDPLVFSYSSKKLQKLHEDMRAGSSQTTVAKVYVPDKYRGFEGKYFVREDHLRGEWEGSR